MTISKVVLLLGVLFAWFLFVPFWHNNPLAFAVVVGGPIVGFVMLLRWSSSHNQSRKVRALEQTFPQFRHAYLHEGTGIGVQPETGTVRLLRTESAKGRIVKDYRFQDVRGFECNLQRGGTALGGQAVAMNATSAINASLANVAVARHNAAVARDNKARTGIFLNVRDVDHPRWRIAFADEQSMDRWMEILRQSISD